MKPTIPTLKVAQVGYDGSPDDRLRINETIDWLVNNFGPVKLAYDVVNLNNGRDFLAEKKTYDIVILHFLFRGDNHLGIPSFEGVMNASQLSSWCGWRSRLVQSGARFIFAFGGAGEISGAYICHLQGYKVHRIRTEDIAQFGNMERGYQGLWVFEKE